jgi:DNA-binding transcriptional ArsR family regulator
MNSQDEILKTASSVFSVFSHPTRLKLVMLLQGGEADVTSLQHQLQISQSSVSQHLGLLKLHHFVVERREGKHVFYALKNPKVLLLISAVMQLLVVELASEVEAIATISELLKLWGL